ncbi:MAG: phage baseplate assembly protein V [Bryobacteraceae bacterium]
MPSSFVEQLASGETRKGQGYSIAPGVVTDNLNLLLEGKVQVRIPSLPAFEVWARMVSVGGGSSRGFMWLPQIKDEVLVAFNENDQRDAYVLGGLWNTIDRPPTAIPTDFMTKRIIKTGLAGGLGHEVEFDDALQSITITSSTKQTVVIDPKKIKISTTAGTMSITLDMVAVPPAITMEVLGGDIALKAPAGKISLQGLQVDIQATATAGLKATGICTISGALVKIN